VYGTVHRCGNIQKRISKTLTTLKDVTRIKTLVNVEYKKLPMICRLHMPDIPKPEKKCIKKIMK